MNIALKLAYDGTNYHGWQSQKNANTIQDELTAAIYKITRERVYVSGCGRTDAGVHAKTYVANFKSGCRIPMEKLPLAVNSMLPDDIAVSLAVKVPDEFDARFSCLKKEYTYMIHVGRTRNPFYQNRAYFCTYTPDLQSMQKAAESFVGQHDFAAVMSQGTPVKSTVRTVYDCLVDKEDDRIHIRVSANGFLYNMVRAIAGTLLYAGIGKIAPEDIDEILKNGKRELAGPTLPPQGLYLTRLWYEEGALC